MSSQVCFSCKESTGYVCITCRIPVCNRQDRSVFAPEETEGWKAQRSVSICRVCNDKKGSSSDSQHAKQSSKTELSGASSGVPVETP